MTHGGLQGVNQEDHWTQHASLPYPHDYMDKVKGCSLDLGGIPSIALIRGHKVTCFLTQFYAGDFGRRILLGTKSKAVDMSNKYMCMAFLFHMCLAFHVSTSKQAMEAECLALYAHYQLLSSPNEFIVYLQLVGQNFVDTFLVNSVKEFIKEDIQNFVQDPNTITWWSPASLASKNRHQYSWIITIITLTNYWNT